jgi:hypothetical protein
VVIDGFFPPTTKRGRKVREMERSQGWNNGRTRGIQVRREQGDIAVNWQTPKISTSCHDSCDFMADKRLEGLHLKIKLWQRSSFFFYLTFSLNRSLAQFWGSLGRETTRFWCTVRFRRVGRWRKAKTSQRFSNQRIERWGRESRFTSTTQQQLRVWRWTRVYQVPLSLKIGSQSRQQTIRYYSERMEYESTTSIKSGTGYIQVTFYDPTDKKLLPNEVSIPIKYRLLVCVSR